MEGNVLYKKKASQIALYMLPGIAIYIFCVIIPIIYGVYISLFNWDGGASKKFIWFKNYLMLFKDGDFWFAFRNNIIITIICVIGQLGISFILAMLFSSKMLRFKSFNRTAIFLPVVLSPIVVGVIWLLIYNQNIGLMHAFINVPGLNFLILPWLDNPNLVIYAICIVLIWQYIGLFMIIWLAGIQNISTSVLEAAELDGATGWKKARYIFLPLLKNTLIVNLILCITGNMKVFDHVYVMTNGGPGRSSMVMALYAYTTSFNMFKLGYGSAQSIMLVILLLAIVNGVLLPLTRRREI